MYFKMHSHNQTQLILSSLLNFKVFYSFYFEIYNNFIITFKFYFILTFVINGVYIVNG